MMKIDTIIKLAWRYYLLSKVGEVLDKVVILPDSEYHHPELEDDEESWKEGKEVLDREMGRYMTPKPLPPISEFRKHYSGTSYLYRIIYSQVAGDFAEILGKLDDDLQPIEPIDLTEYKNRILRGIKETESLILGIKDLDRLQEEKLKLQGMRYIADNFDQIFNSKAINIIANRYGASDEVGPLAVDHDIGHGIMIEKLLQEEFSTISAKKSLAMDYYLEDSFGRMKEFDALSLDDYICYLILDLILARSNLIPGSISALNLDRGFVGDLSTDLMIHYNLNFESLDKLKVEGIVIPVGKGFRPINGKLSKAEYYLKPKDPGGLIPNVEEYIKGVLGKIDQEGIIRERLDGLVGKVFRLW